MTCIKKIQNTEVYGSKFSSRTLTIAGDISEYTFKAVVKNIIQGKILEIPGIKNAGTINFDFSQLQTLKKSTYQIEYWGDFDTLGNEPFLLEELSIVSAENATNCANTDNLNFEIKLEEITIPVTISKAINQFFLDFESLSDEQKAELKGDAFTYEDFTPEQIAELQKPATDKVVELDALETALTNSESLRVQNENARISNEEIRNTNETNRISSENLRQENEVSRIENENGRALAETERNSTEAVRSSNENTRISSENTRNTNEQSRVNAENNRVTAESSRVTAEQTRQVNTATAITNANNAATNANNAATNANEKAVLADIAATNANNVANTYATTLYMKAEKGGSTKTLKQVEDMTSNLLYEYTHSGNIEVQVQSIDYTTNTFTKTAHGIVNGDRLGLRVFGTISYENQIPLIFPFSTNLPTSNWDAGYFVVNATENTFQISTTSGGTPITLINRASVNLTLWRFEKLTETNVGLTPFPTNGVNVEIVGDIMKAFNYVFFGSEAHTWGYNDIDTNIQPITNKTIAYLLKGYYSISIRRDADRMVQIRKWYGFNLNQTDNKKLTMQKGETYSVSANAFKPLHVDIKTAFLTNGTKIRFYKL